MQPSSSPVPVSASVSPPASAFATVAAALNAGASIDGIQFMRGIAALMVVAHHARHYFAEADAWTNVGSRGVDIFFVISGFIMAHSTAAYRADGDRAGEAGRFLLRRVLRVVPLYWLALLWTTKRAIVAGQWGADDAMDMLFVPHFHRVYQGAIYPSLVPGWTINDEMFFYVLFAVSMLFGCARYRVLGGTLAALATLGTIAWSSAPAQFYTSSVILEFLYGIGLYLLLRQGRRALGNRWTPRPWTWVVLAAIGLALLAIENSDAVRGIADGPFAALIVGSVVMLSQGRRIAGLKALGDASYSIYLFHLASFALSGYLLHRIGIAQATPANIVIAVSFQVVIAVLVGLLVHRVVEAPLLRLLQSAISPKRGPPVLLQPK